MTRDQFGIIEINKELIKNVPNNIRRVPGDTGKVPDIIGNVPLKNYTTNYYLMC
jgi:hypothetical protein